jgi:uncharacterized protein YneF (UPF0154 family)
MEFQIAQKAVFFNFIIGIIDGVFVVIHAFKKHMGFPLG